MRILLDTHAFLWAVIDPDKLSTTAHDLLEDADTQVTVSAASAWEIATKFRLGKLPGADRVVEDYDWVISKLRASQLAVTSAHGIKAGSYPQPHADPFDRMLAAQAELEELVLMSCDPAMAQFGIETIW